MKKLFKARLLLAFFFAPIQPGLVIAAEVLDATGTRVRIVEMPRRIVTLAPSLGELAADLGGDIQRIAGVSDYTDWPVALKKVKSVGSYARFNLEEVVALKPDLVLATLDGNARDQINHLRELGLAVVVVGTENFSQIEGSIDLISRAMGNPVQGQKLLEKLRTGIQEIRAKAAKNVKKRVLMQVGDNPLIVVGRGSFLHEALEAVGAVNVYGETGNLKNHYPRPSLEDVVKKNPDVVLVLALSHDLKSFEEMASRWSRFPSMKAVQSHNVRVLQGDTVLRPTLRLLDGLKLLEQGVHGGSQHR